MAPKMVRNSVDATKCLGLSAEGRNHEGRVSHDRDKDENSKRRAEQTSIKQIPKRNTECSETWCRGVEQRRQNQSRQIEQNWNVSGIRISFAFSSPGGRIASRGELWALLTT